MKKLFVSLVLGLLLLPAFAQEEVEFTADSPGAEEVLPPEMVTRNFGHDFGFGDYID